MASAQMTTVDYSKFLDDTFEPKEWINAAFRSNKDSGATNDQYATTLVMKLQLLVQEVNNVIEETSQEVVSNLPRVLRDIEAIKQEASLLQEQMKHIKQDVQKVEQDTSQSMQTLLQLDTIKCRMEQTSEALQQADNWTVLSSEVEDVIQSADADLLTSKLVAMQQSLRLLANVPDYDDRCQHLEALKNRLETLVTPNIINALTNNSQESTRKYVKMFESIQRLPQMYRYYEHFHKSVLSKNWSELQEREDKPLPHTLSLFYDTIVSALHTQVSWCSGVFDEPVEVVCNMITVSLQSIEKNMASSFSQYLETQDNVLSAITELKQVTDRFAKTMEKALSERLDSDKVRSDYVKLLAAVTYEPYIPYTKEYAKLESHYINERLNNIEMEDRRFIDTSISKLSGSISKVFKVARSLDDRCHLLTGGVGYLSINDIYKQYFTNFSNEVKRILVNFGEKFKSHLGDDQVEVDSWTMFSYSLQIIQITGEIIMEIEELDCLVVANVLSSTDQLNCISVSPMTDFRVIYITSDDQVTQLETLRDAVSEKQTILTSSLKILRSLSEQAHKLAFDSVFSQIATHLHSLSESEVWMSKSAGGALTADLPTFSLSPQEYITQIGQYIMTLPQYLDPFTSDTQDGTESQQGDNTAINVAVKYGRLPYTKLQDREGEHLDSIWLESISRATMYTYCEEIQKIPEITSHATKQLVTDIDYLINVLDDLGLAPIEPLSNIKTLLNASPGEYSDVSKSLPKTLTSLILAMRNLDL